MKRISLLLLTVMLSGAIVSCSPKGLSNSEFKSAIPESISSDENSQNFSSTSEMSNQRNIKVPNEVVGAPNRIYIVTGKKKKVFEVGTDGYNQILNITCSRFPETLKEAAFATVDWIEDGRFNWDKISNEMDFIRLEYDTTQTVTMDCMNKNYKDFPAKEISFNDLLFPLMPKRDQTCIVGLVNTYGVLDNSPEIMSKLLEYAD